jgi:6,7-dimethyl-8-ribityllumazine synthase
MSTNAPDTPKLNLPSDGRVAIVAARFNAEIVDALLDGCLKRLEAEGISGGRVDVHRVPGAFELPVTAAALARTGQFGAVICLGCVVRGDTPHFDYVAGEAARGIMQVSVNERLPVIFGVLTTNTEQQAWDRTGGSHGHNGERAAEAAMEMISVLATIKTNADRASLTDPTNG